MNTPRFLDCQLNGLDTVTYQNSTHVHEGPAQFDWGQYPFGWRIHPTFDSSVQTVLLHLLIQNRLVIIVQVITNFKMIFVSH
jgi:hypothetical protein